MKDLSRAEVGELLQAQAEKLVLAPALLFLGAGSLWLHLSMGPVFFNLPLFSSWLLVHLCGFAALAWPRLERTMVALGVLSLQVYLFVSVSGLHLPFLPSAPLFFLVSSVTLIGYRVETLRRSLKLWALGWLSFVVWNHFAKEPGGAPEMGLAADLAIALNVVLLYAFTLLTRSFAQRVEEQIQALGPRQNYDDQRLQAAKMQTLGELTVSLAHEINNPLTALSGFAHQIRGELREAQPSAARLQEAAERIQHNIERVHAIGRVLKNFSRDPGADEKTEIGLRAVVDDVLLLMAHNLKSAGIDLRLEFPHDDIRIQGSLVQLSQLLANLLANARDACEASSLKQVTLGFAARGEDRACLWVEDSGPGIANDVAESVFRPFFTTKALGKGTGLGLYISQIIARRHQAHLRHQTRRDPHSGKVLGARFELELVRVLPRVQQAA